MWRRIRDWVPARMQRRVGLCIGLRRIREGVWQRDRCHERSASSTELLTHRVTHVELYEERVGVH
jgi:hypothetical protein